MCLIVFGWGLDGRHPVVVAGNRDEFYARPTRSAAWTDDGVLAGRDLRGGGTWMGVTRGGRFAALTNHRDPSAMRSDAPTRGALCDRLLHGDTPMADTMTAIAQEAPAYNGFNLLAGSWTERGDVASLRILSSHGRSMPDSPSDAASPQSVARGIHGLSNASLDTPWPKVEHAKARLAAAVADDPRADVLIARLFALLADPSTAAPDALPSTGVAPDLERALSAAFIRLPTYGTRSATVLLVDRRGRVTFVERRCEPDALIDESRFAFESGPE